MFLIQLYLQPQSSSRGSESFIGACLERERERGVFHSVDTALFMPSTIISNLR